MTLQKRLFDIVLAIGLMVVLAIPFVALLLWLLLREGRPLFHVSERMKTPDQAFILWKLRSMRPSSDDSGVTGGDKSNRITRTGHLLRRTRLDELPQLWNILRGDMSFVGPRPPLRQYVVRFPAIYAQVLRMRPGVTGLATLSFHRHEEMLIAQARSTEETDQIYTRRCIPRKARLDMLYATRQNLCFDCVLMLRTLRKVLPRGR